MGKTLQQVYDTVRFAFSHLSKGNGRYIAVALTASLAEAALPFVNIFAVRFIIEEITTSRRLNVAAAYAAVMLACNVLLREGLIFLNWRKSLLYLRVTDQFFSQNSAKFMRVDYKCMETPKDLDQMQNMYRAESLTGQVLEQVCDLVTAFIGVLGTLAIISSLHPAFMVLVAGITLSIALVNGKAMEKSNRIELEAAPVKRLGGYLSDIVLSARTRKEISLFSCKDFLLGKIVRNDREQHVFTRKKTGVLLGANLFSVALSGVQTFCLYGYMSLEFIRGAISISAFSLYLGTAKNFAGCTLKIIQALTGIAAQNEFVQKQKAFSKMPETLREGGSEPLPRPDASAEIEFKDVWFRYPSSDAYILENINFKMKAGETLSIVGENGAGKTTLIKLLCRLYAPTKGTILLNGTPLERYDYDGYMRCIAAVFQDYRLFSFTVRENLDCTGTRTDSEISAALEKCGILEKVKGLPQGLDSHLYKGNGWDGVELSGGEYQKLAISRAYLKDAGCVIMDEPTAAVDPISEYNIYKSFHLLTKGKNAIFISHRMSSSIFADRVLFLAGRTVAEIGTHEELMAAGGLYANMFETQARNYK